MLLTIDYRKLFKIIDREMITLNQYMQDAGAEAVMINQVQTEIKFDLQIQLQRSHKIIIKMQTEDLGAHMIAICNRKAKEMRIQNKMNPVLTNIKYTGYYAIQKNNKLLMKSINEILRIEDTREVEK